MALSQAEQTLIDLNRSLLSTMQQMSKQMAGVGNYSKQANEALLGVSRTTQTTEKTFSNINTSAQNFNKSLKDSNKEASTFKKVMQGIGESLKQAAKDMLNLTSLFTAGQIVTAVADMRQEFLRLSRQMAMGRKEMEYLTDSILRTQIVTGESLATLQQMASTLIKLRVSTRDFAGLLKTTQEFSRATGISAQSAAKLVGELNRFGKMGNDAIRRVVGSIALIQKQFGMTAEEAEGLTDSLMLATKRLQQVGASGSQIENFSKGTMRLAAAFSSVGVEAGEAAKIIERLLDPGAIEDNALLFAKLGVSIHDAINGQIDPTTLISGFKNLGQELTQMTGPAAAAMARQLGMSLTDIRQMATMDEAAISEKFNLAANASSALTEQANNNRDVMDNISQIWESIKGTIGSIVNVVLPVFVPILERINKIIKGTGNILESTFIQNLKKGAMWLTDMLDRLLNGPEVENFGKGIMDFFAKLPETIGNIVNFLTNDLPKILQNIGPILMTAIPLLGMLFGGGIKKAFSTNTESISNTMSDAVSTGYLKGVEKANMIQAQRGGGGGGGVAGGNADLGRISKNINEMNFGLFEAQRNSGLLLGFAKPFAEMAEKTHKSVWGTNDGFGRISNMMTNIIRKNEDNYTKTMQSYEANIALGKAKFDELGLLEQEILRRRAAGEITATAASRALKDIQDQKTTAEEFWQTNQKGAENYSARMRKSLGPDFFKAQLDTAKEVVKAANDELALKRQTREQAVNTLTSYRQQFALAEDQIKKELEKNISGEKRIRLQRTLNELQEEQKKLQEAVTQSAKEEVDATRRAEAAQKELTKAEGEQGRGRGVFSAIGGLFTNFRTKLGESFKSIGANFGSILSNGIKGLGNALRGGLRAAGGLFMKLAPFLVFLEPLRDVMNGLFETIAKDLQPVFDAILPVLQMLFKDVLLPLVRALLPPMLKVLSALLGGIGWLVKGIGELTGNRVLQEFGDSITQAADKMWDAADKLAITAKLDAERKRIEQSSAAVLSEIFGPSGVITQTAISQAVLTQEQEKAIKENYTALRENTKAQLAFKNQEALTNFAVNFKSLYDVANRTGGVTTTEESEISNAVKLAFKGTPLEEMMNNLSFNDFKRLFFQTGTTDAAQFGDVLFNLNKGMSENAALTRNQVIREILPKITSENPLEGYTQEAQQAAREAGFTHMFTGAGDVNSLLYALSSNDIGKREAAFNALRNMGIITGNTYRDPFNAAISTETDRQLNPNATIQQQIEVLRNLVGRGPTPGTTMGGATTEGGGTDSRGGPTVYSSVGAGVIAERAANAENELRQKLITLQEEANRIQREILAQTTQARIEAMTNNRITQEERNEILRRIRNEGLSGEALEAAIVDANGS